MKPFVASLLVLAWSTTASMASAQTIAPLRIGGPAQSALQQLHPPTPIEQVREQAMRRPAPLPLPEPAAERLVPERRLRLPEFGNREVVIPGHYERRISDQQYVVPTLPAYELNGGLAGIVPGGNRPPADVRQGP
jgi:hypothetical protein